MSLEYLAGFFDGEACIRGALQPSGALVISINISLKNPIPLVKLKTHFGVGTIALYPQCPPYKYYTFTAYSQNAQIILTELLPYLIVKREEAELALEALQYSRDLSQVHHERLIEIFNQLRQIKRRPPHDLKILDSQVALPA